MIVIMVLIIFNAELIHYGLIQAKGQLNIISNSVPVDSILSDSTASEEIRNKIRLVQEVKKYAQEIGLKSTDNYETFYDQKGKSILWNVSACEPYAFVPYEWRFPILGSFGYKGFFDLEMAKREEAKLKAQNYDTNIRSVGAWSTLGWFRDPILSNMLDRSTGDLAELIFHELTHSTIFVKDSLEFNENLASFIGQQAAADFLRLKYGPQSDELYDYLKELHDDNNYRDHILRGKETLDSLYQSFNNENDIDSKNNLKKRCIEKIVSSLDTVTFHSDKYRRIFLKAIPNNAYFMSFNRYYAYDDELNELLEENSNILRDMIEFCTEQFAD